MYRDVSGVSSDGRPSHSSPITTAGWSPASYPFHSVFENQIMSLGQSVYWKLSTGREMKKRHWQTVHLPLSRSIGRDSFAKTEKGEILWGGGNALFSLKFSLSLPSIVFAGWWNMRWWCHVYACLNLALGIAKRETFLKFTLKSWCGKNIFSKWSLLFFSFEGRFKVTRGESLKPLMQHI